MSDHNAEVLARVRALLDRWEREAQALEDNAAKSDNPHTAERFQARAEELRMQIADLRKALEGVS
ncbi:MAG: hypothetical protein R3310_01270 [Candidatus Competibacteraceae bacterium]|nr:hypothetical protein [Candidatus Competibacteraceae bacterium]